MAKVAYLALGSNQGNRIQFIQDALRRIGETPGIETLACSEIEETEPVGKTDQAFFLNCIAAIKTSLTPHELLAVCHKVEGAGGRLRTEKWGPRTIDVDIVEMENVLVDEDDLILPHPELINRQFWIRELAEVKSGVKSE